MFLTTENRPEVNSQPERPQNPLERFSMARMLRDKVVTAAQGILDIPSDLIPKVVKMPLLVLREI